MAIFDKDTVRQAFWAIVIIFMALVAVNLYNKWDDFSFFGDSDDVIISKQKVRISELEGTVSDLESSLRTMKALSTLFEGVKETDIKLIASLFKEQMKIDKETSDVLRDIDNIPDDPAPVTMTAMITDHALDIGEEVVTVSQPQVKKTTVVSSAKPTHLPKSEKVSAAVIDILWNDYCENQTTQKCGG